MGLVSTFEPKEQSLSVWGLFSVEKFCERERSVALVPSHRKYVYLGLHIKQNADGPELSCPVMLRATYKPDYKEKISALEDGSCSIGSPGSVLAWAGAPVNHLSLREIVLIICLVCGSGHIHFPEL